MVLFALIINSVGSVNNVAQVGLGEGRACVWWWWW
jgi:hypothetical protein